MERSVSPLYQFNYAFGALAAGVRHLDLEMQPYGRYLPFNFFRVVNNTDVDFNFTLGTNHQILVPAGFSMSLNYDIIKGYHAVSFENTINATTGDLSINIQRIKVKLVDKL